MGSLSNTSDLNTDDLNTDAGVRVLIVDPDASNREIVVRYLRTTPGIEVVGDVRSGDECWRILPTTEPDVIVLDLNLNGSSQAGIELISHFRRAYQRVRFVIHSSYLAEHYTELVVAPNVLGYVQKGDPVAAVVEAVRAAAGDRTYLSQTVYDQICKGYRGSD